MPGREAFANQLQGSGLDLGPGNHPFAVPEDVTVAYVDRWIPDESRELYPELPADSQFPKPDVVANFDIDRLTMIPSTSQDFVIASHLLEHLADPIGFLGEMYRVLRPGGLAIVLLPDMRRTFDRNREITPLAHLTAEHAAGVTAVDDDHILEFLVGADVPFLWRGGAHSEIPADPEERDELVAWYRQRSIHAHCWTDADFPEVLRYCTEELGQQWEVLETLPTGDGEEFGYLLRRAPRPAGRFGRWRRSKRR